MGDKFLSRSLQLLYSSLQCAAASRFYDEKNAVPSLLALRFALCTSTLLDLCVLKHRREKS